MTKLFSPNHPGNAKEGAQYVLLRRREKFALFLFFAALVIGPFMLGANRGWAWPLVVGVLFVAWLLMSGWDQFTPWRDQPVLVGALAALVVIPFVQILPMPVGLIEVLAPGRLLYADDGAGWLTISLDKGGTLDELILQLGYLVAAALALSIFKIPSARKVFVVTLVTLGVVNSVFGFVNFYTEGALAYFQPATWKFWQGVTGSYVNKNHFAGLLQLCIPFAVVLVMQKLPGRPGIPGYWRQAWSLDMVLPVGAVVVLVGALLATGSRGGNFSLLLSLLVILGFAHRGSITGHVRQVVVVVVLLVVLLCASILLIGWDALSSVYLSKGTANLRVNQWYETIIGWPGFMLLGSGANAYTWFYAPLKSPGMSNLIFDHAHNDYLEVAVTFGLVGLAAFVSIVIFSLGRGLLHLRSVGAITSTPMLFAATWAGLSVALHSLVDFNLQIPANAILFVVVMSLCVVLVDCRAEPVRH